MSKPEVSVETRLEQARHMLNWVNDAYGLSSFLEIGEILGTGWWVLYDAAPDETTRAAILLACAGLPEHLAAYAEEKARR